MKLTALIFLMLISCEESVSQNIFNEKFKGCNTSHFALESDSITAKIEDNELLKVLINGFDNKTKEKIRGVLSLQIIVDQNGSSCLISLKNDTNIQTRKLALKENIDNKLVWQKPKENISAIVVLKFEDGGVKFKRLGINANRGVHEIH